MKHNCDDCEKSIKEVGRLFKVKINRSTVIHLCGSCRKKERCDYVY